MDAKSEKKVKKRAGKVNRYVFSKETKMFFQKYYKVYSFEII